MGSVQVGKMDGRTSNSQEAECRTPDVADSAENIEDCMRQLAAEAQVGPAKSELDTNVATSQHRDTAVQSLCSGTGDFPAFQTATPRSTPVLLTPAALRFETFTEPSQPRDPSLPFSLLPDPMLESRLTLP